MSVHDASGFDVYEDAQGNLWRVVWTCSEPTVCMERIYRTDEILAQLDAPPQERSKFEAMQISGGVGGFMWQGFTRISKGSKP